MTWIALLLADPSPCLRSLVLRELMGRTGRRSRSARAGGPARRPIPLVADLLALQQPDGAWGPASIVGLAHGDERRSTGPGAAPPGLPGLRAGAPGGARGAAFLFAQQRADGAWPLPGAPAGGR